MADNNTIQLILQAQDNISKVLKNVEGGLGGVQKKVEESKGFLSTVKEHWMGLAASATAAYVAINKAWAFAETAAQFQEQKASLDALAAKYGTTADAIISSVQSASKGLISMADAADTAGKALMKGMTPQQLTELAAAAETLSNVTGQKVAVEFKNLAEAIALGRERALEMSIGIIDLNAKFGDQVSKMTDAEKANARYQIAMEKVAEIQGRLGESTDSVGDKMERFTVQMQDLQLNLGEVLIRAGMGAIAVFQSLAAGLLGIGYVATQAARGVAILTDALGLTKGDADKLKESAEAMKIAMNDLNKQASQGFKDMVSGADAAKKSTGALTDGIKAQAQTYEDYIKGLQAGSKEYEKIQGAETKALEAKIEYEKALLAKSLADKKISQEKYVEEIIKIQEKQFKAEWANLDSQIQAAKAEGEKGFAHRAELEAQKTELIQKHATERLKTETDATNEATKIQEKGFTDWKSLQELKLQSIQAQMSLEEAMDKSAVDAGVLRESDAMANSLQRLKEFNQAKLSELSEAISKEAALHGADSPELKKLYAEREQLQMDLQAKIITSEQQIADTRIKEETEAFAILAELTGDREKLIEQEYANSLKVIKDYYAQGKFSQEQYNLATDALDKKRTADLQKNLDAQGKIMHSFVIATRSQMDALKQSLSDALDIDLTNSIYKIEYFSRWYGGAMMPGLIATTGDAINRIRDIIGTVPAVMADAFNNMGRFVSGAMFTYAQQIADYVNWIEAKVMGLQALIQGYQETLLQMQGDEVGLVDLWHVKEIARLKQEFAGLEDSAEYKKALKLIEEIYKKKLEEAEKALIKEEELREQYATKGGGSSGQLGNDGTVDPFAPLGTAEAGTQRFENPFDNLRQKLEDALTPAKDFFGMDFFTKPMSLDMKKEINNHMQIDMKILDDGETRRVTKEVIWPEIKRLMELEGV